MSACFHVHSKQICQFYRFRDKDSDWILLLLPYTIVLPFFIYNTALLFLIALIYLMHFITTTVTVLVIIVRHYWNKLLDKNLKK